MSTPQSLKVAAATRTVTGKAVAQLRRDGQLPAVVYGNGKNPANISIDAREFSKLYNQAGSTTLLDLSIDNGKVIKVLVHDIQENRVRHELLHVDFFEVNLKEKLRTNVPLTVVSESEAVETLDGTLVTVKDEVEVECLPQDLIQSIEVDISPLKTFEDVLRVSDLVVPAGVVILDDPEEVIFSVTEPRSEAEMDALDEQVVEGATEFETEDGTKPAEEEKADEAK